MKSTKLIIKNTAQKEMAKFGLNVEFMTLNIWKLDFFSCFLNSF